MHDFLVSMFVWQNNYEHISHLDLYAIHCNEVFSVHEQAKQQKRTKWIHKYNFTNNGIWQKW